MGTADYPIEKNGPWWWITDEGGAEVNAEIEHNELSRRGAAGLHIV